jgi:hypothetical protein
MTNSGLRRAPAGWGILTPFPSATALALALGARLTLRGLTLRRNPWTFGVRVSRPHKRYSCQHSHFRYLQHASRPCLRRPTERSATTPESRCQKSDIRSQKPDSRISDFCISVLLSAVLTSEFCLLESAASVRGLSPVTFSARDSLNRPVSYYAFFKGWLLLSQPPGCLGRPTSFPT